MQADIQKASLWKRIAAWILDLILVAVISVGVMYLVSVILGCDQYIQQVEASYDHYEEAYGISFEVSQDEYEAFSEEERKNWDDAYQALIDDDEAMHAYNMMVNLILITTTVGLLVSIILCHFVMPLILKNGQTVGKKAFNLGLVRQDGVKMNTMQLFVRAVLGQFTLETMIPVYIIIMLLWGTIGMIGPAVLILLIIAQLICMTVTRNNTALHDMLAGTVVVDISLQKVFESKEELVEYTKKLHAERAARQLY